MTNAEAFADYDRRNPRLYAGFVGLTLKAIRAGRTRGSAKMVYEALRWDSYLRAEDGDFKINDKFVGHYARKFADEYPQHSGFFSFRVLRV